MGTSCIGTSQLAGAWCDALTIPERSGFVSNDDDGLGLPPWPLVLASTGAGAALGLLLLWWGYLNGYHNGALGRRIRRLQGAIRGRTSQL